MPNGDVLRSGAGWSVPSTDPTLLTARLQVGGSTHFHAADAQRKQAVAFRIRAAFVALRLSHSRIPDVRCAARVEASFFLRGVCATRQNKCCAGNTMEHR